MKKILLLFALLLFAVNTNAQSTTKVHKQNTVNQKEFIQVYMNNKGKVFVNGKKTDLKNLEEKLQTLQKRNGVIHYSKSEIKKKPLAKKNVQIMELFAKYKRSIRFYTDKSFSKEIIW